MFADPHWWSRAYEHISTVSLGAHVHSAPLDFYLMQEWYSMAQDAAETDCKAFYLDKRTIQDLLTGTPKHTIRTHLLFSDDDNRIPKAPVLFLQGDNDGGRQTLVLLDYTAKTVFLFGSSGYNLDDSIYVSWNSMRYWKTIAQAFEWTVDGDDLPVSYQLNWVQVGLENGNTESITLAHIPPGGVRKPPRHCFHHATYFSAWMVCTQNP